MRLPELSDSLIDTILVFCVVIFAASWLYAAWCYQRLYNLLAKYGSSVLPNAGNDPALVGFKNTRQLSPVLRYINAKDFEKEARPEIRAAGKRAYRGHQIIKWITLPVMIFAFLLFYLYYGILHH